MSLRIDFNIDNPDLAWAPGKMKISGTNPQGVNVDVYTRFVYATGDVIPETLIASNVAPAAAFSNTGLDVPVDGDDVVLSGVFTYYIILKSAGGSTVLQTISVTSGGPNPTGPNKATELSILKSLNTLEGSFTLTDQTAVSTASGVTATRDWTVTGPTVLAVPGGTFTSTTDSIKVFFNYTNVTYSVLYKLDIEYEFYTGDIDLFEYYQLSSDFEYPVKILSLCSTKTCLNTEINKFKATACRVGGFDKMSGADRARMLRLMLLLNQWELAEDCNDDASKQLVYDELVANFACCTTEDSDEIVRFTLPDGSNPVEVPWTAVVTAFTAGFLNGVPALRWRVTKDNELRILGRIQIPAGLVASSVNIVTSGFVTVSLASMPGSLLSAAIDVNGNTKGVFRLQTNGDLIFVPNATTTLEFIQVDISFPLS